LILKVAHSAPVRNAGNGHYYELVTGVFTWDQAFAGAQTRSNLGRTGYLVTITTAQEEAFLQAQGFYNGQAVWAGGSDNAQEGIWQWVSGPETGSVFFTTTGGCAIYCNWDPGEPNNAGGSENYLMIYGTTTGRPIGNWNDVNVNNGFVNGGYIVEYDNPCLSSGGTYHTQSEGDWGDSCASGFPEACYRDTNFASCFPSGVTVGCTSHFTIQLTSSLDVQNYLPQLGSPSVLTQSYVNPNVQPISTTSGNFGSQVTALALSLGFESCDNLFHSECASLSNLYVCDNRCLQCKRNNNCKRNSQSNCRFVSRDDMFEESARNNNNDGTPSYPNCENFFNWQVKDIFNAANNLLGGCSCQSHALSREATGERNSCKRNSSCRKKSIEQRNSDGCCVNQESNAQCDPVTLNACIAFINQAFIFGKTLNDVDSGNLFKESQCNCAGQGYEWTATVNGVTAVMNPFVVYTDIQDYYGYNKGFGSSANTPDGLELTNTGKALLEFITDGFGLQNLLVIYSSPNNNIGGSAISTIAHAGNLAGATFIVDDDPGEGLTVAPGLFTTAHNWAGCCTDGYVLGPIPNFACFTWTLGATRGITELRLATNNGDQSNGGTAIAVPKVDGTPIVVNICNQCLGA